ncbi:sterol desaturase family [Plectosphaerella plurivora]|uniref:Sterol desaturase family n=1 Tax=Plectosphaerella plurivora TaxID=936078 RepID=A0A9P8V6M8_9PEZI|nr:sterol desaturase family [Plectosphaerella plurivora]
MDLLLSLPIVSYFLAPSVTSWSTSLNLLFFYMTWTTLVLSHSPLRVEIIGTLVLRVMFWLVPSLVFLLFDGLVPTIAESLKQGGTSALPPTAKGPVILRTLGLALFNLTLSTAIQAGISVLWTYATGETMFRASTTLPFPWQVIKHIGLLLLAREILTYYLHGRMLHGRSRPATLHKRHAHARRAPPFSLLVFADHPVPFLLHRFIPAFLPAAILRLHLLTYFVFMGIITLEETLAMSGYSTVPGIVMGGIARRTAIHYAAGGDGNFGPWGVLDWAHGTSVGKDVLEDVRDEAEKHAVKERSEKAAASGISAVREGIEGFTSGRGKAKGRSSRRSS